jgi:hypothetical protein
MGVGSYTVVQYVKAVYCIYVADYYLVVERKEAMSHSLFWDDGFWKKKFFLFFVCVMLPVALDVSRLYYTVCI